MQLVSRTGLAIALGLVTLLVARPALPVAQAAQATEVPVHDHWMADLSTDIGPLPIGEVIIPGSHDTGTYALNDFMAAAAPAYAVTQDIDVAAQLQHGIRQLDIRATYHDRGNGAVDYYILHSDSFITDLSLEDILDDVQAWVATPGHEKEIVILRVRASSNDNPARFNEICQHFKSSFGSLLIAPSSADPSRDISRSTMNQLWSMPDSPRVITDWSACTGASWLPNGPGKEFSGYYANQCYAAPYLVLPVRTGVIGALAAALEARGDATDLPGGATQESPFVAATGTKDRFGMTSFAGFYSLGLHSSQTADCLFPLTFFAHEQSLTMDAVKSWFDTDQHRARANLNILTADFVEQTRLVEYAIAMNTRHND
jgi:hypothetical protein